MGPFWCEKHSTGLRCPHTAVVSGARRGPTPEKPPGEPGEPETQTPMLINALGLDWVIKAWCGVGVLTPSPRGAFGSPQLGVLGEGDRTVTRDECSWARCKGKVTVLAAATFLVGSLP